MDHSAILSLPGSERISVLKEKMLDEPRYVSIEQARIVTEVYQQTEGQQPCIRRARALQAALTRMSIRLEPEERIVGNRTPGVRAGVVFPETGASWVDREFETLPTRAQDRFQVRPEDITEFRTKILPYWKGRSLEDQVRAAIGPEVDAIAKVAKINQKDHSQGHICPNTEKWLRLGPAGLRAQAAVRLETADAAHRDFYESIILVMDGACTFMRRYADLAEQMAAGPDAENLREVARICRKLASAPAETYHEAVQATWFLYVILQMEGNASSFSPGRMDQYLYPYYRFSRIRGMTDSDALEITQCLWLKFDEIVYLRNSGSARYFAGFPIGFNVAIGGQKDDGSDASNELSYLFLRAQALLLLPQPNLSLRIFRDSPQELLEAASRVIGLGSGMPQIFNDEAVIPALTAHGISDHDARNYAIVGCVELTTHGNALGWSDAAMFNLVKALELTLSGGIYQMGLYTVSAHVPMGQNVGASADGRLAGDPLADGGVSAMYGRDTSGPTALLQSVARLPFRRASNGTLLNMKFLPAFFQTDTGIRKFTQLLRAVCALGISHIQFNVLNEADLRAAQREPEKYRGLTVRVAGYTAYFTELAPDLQDEIIARRAYEGV